MPLSRSSHSLKMIPDKDEILWELHSRLPDDRSFIQQWDELAENQDVPSIFLGYEWITTWWQHFGTNKQLFLITGTCKNRLIALAPMMVSMKPLLPLRPSRIMEFIGTSGVPSRGMGLADRVDFLYPPGHQEILSELLTKLLDYSHYFDLLLIRALPASSPALVVLKKIGAKLGLRFYQSFRSQSPYTRTEGTWEDFLATRKSKIKRQWRNSCRRLERFGHYEISCFPDNGWSFEKTMETLLSINRESYKWQKGSSLFQTPDLLKFYNDLFRRISSKWLIVHFILIEGKAVAYQAGFRYARRFFGYNTAYRKSYAQVHPGIHLIIHMIRIAFGESCIEYDMMRGEEPYKSHWKSGQREEIHFVAYHHRLFSKIAFWVYITGKDFLKKMFDRIPLRPALAGLYGRFHSRQTH